MAGGCDGHLVTPRLDWRRSPTDSISRGDGTVILVGTLILTILKIYDRIVTDTQLGRKYQHTETLFNDGLESMGNAPSGGLDDPG